MTDAYIQKTRKLISNTFANNVKIEKRIFLPILIFEIYRLDFQFEPIRFQTNGVKFIIIFFGVSFGTTSFLFFCWCYDR